MHAPRSDRSTNTCDGVQILVSKYHRQIVQVVRQTLHRSTEYNSVLKSPSFAP
jgi:hypothetical protein